MKKRYKIVLFFAFVFSIGFYVATIHILPYSIIKPPRTNGINVLDSKNIQYTNIEVKSFDSINLKGYYVKSSRDSTHASIILVHGIGGCKEDFTNLAATLANKGFDVWLFDNRAHGKSGGLFSTYGFYEKMDISEIVTTIQKETPNTKIGIWGNSLGGAIAIQSLAFDKRIEFGIIESAFSDLRQIVYDYQKRFCYGVGLKFASDIALNEAGEIANFIPDEVKPIKSASEIYQPLLVCHGDADMNINVNNSKVLYERIKSKEKELIIVKGGAHYGLSETGGPAYQKKLFEFLKNQAIK